MKLEYINILGEWAARAVCSVCFYVGYCGNFRGKNVRKYHVESDFL